MEIQFEIQTPDIQEVFEQLTGENEKPDLGQEYHIGNDINLTYISGYDDEFLDSETLLFIATNLTGFGINLFASYVYDKLKDNKKNKLLINGSEVEINQRVIEDFLIFLKDKEQKTKPNDE